MDDISMSDNDISKEDNKIQTKHYNLEFINFIEIFIYSILYLREIYSKDLFQQYAYYNLNILKIIKHKNIAQIIDTFINHIENKINYNEINKIYILLVDVNNKYIYEMFTLTFSIKTYNDFNYNDLCFDFKAILLHLYMKLENREININVVSNNKAFLLGTDIIKENDIKNYVYDNINFNISEQILYDLIKNDFNIKIYNQPTENICYYNNNYYYLSIDYSKV